MPRVRPALLDDAAQLAPTLREADQQEIKANLGDDPLLVLERGIAQSDLCYAVIDDEDKRLALFGVVPDTEDKDVGLVWLLGSDELSKHSFFVLRNTRKWLEVLHQRYRVLWNHIDARNELHIRWLQWSGFTVLRRVEEFGVEQRPFYEFERIRDSEPGNCLIESGVPGQCAGSKK
jgi:hypothetical protein